MHALLVLLTSLALQLLQLLYSIDQDQTFGRSPWGTVAALPMCCQCCQAPIAVLAVQRGQTRLAFRLGRTLSSQNQRGVR